MDTADKLMKIAIEGEVDDEVETVDEGDEVVEKRTTVRRRSAPPDDDDRVVVVED